MVYLRYDIEDLGGGKYVKIFSKKIISTIEYFHHCCTQLLNTMQSLCSLKNPHAPLQKLCQRRGSVDELAGIVIAGEL